MGKSLFLHCLTALSLGLSVLCAASPTPATLFRRQTDPTCSPPVGIKTPNSRCTTIWVGKNAPTDGQVCVSVSGTDLVVTYGAITSPSVYLYTAIHLYVGAEPPTKRSPGLFPYADVATTNAIDACDILNGGTTAVCTIPLSALSATCDGLCNDNDFFIAAHADVTSQTQGSATAWGFGTCFDSPSTGFCAQYFSITFDCTPLPQECTTGGTAYCKIDGFSTPFNQAWGWILNPTVGDIRESGSAGLGTLWMGAGQSDTAAGTNVGSCKLVLSDNHLTITYTFGTGFIPGTSHVYISTINPGDHLPPGQFGFQLDTGHVYTFTTSSVDSPTGTQPARVPGNTMTYLAVDSTQLYLLLHVEIKNTCPAPVL